MLHPYITAYICLACSWYWGFNRSRGALGFHFSQLSSPPTLPSKIFILYETLHERYFPLISPLIFHFPSSFLPPSLSLSPFLSFCLFYFDLIQKGCRYPINENVDTKFPQVLAYCCCCRCCIILLLLSCCFLLCYVAVVVVVVVHGIAVMLNKSI